MNELSYTIFTRAGEKMNRTIVKHKVETIDFLIDNNSLLSMLVRKFGGHGDYAGCFSKGWASLNKDSKAKLLLEKGSDTADGRIAVYVCPECADIGCGAFCCNIEQMDDYYIWKDFAYENDYEDARIIHGMGPYCFNKILYEKLIIKIFKEIT